VHFVQVVKSADERVLVGHVLIHDQAPLAQLSQEVGFDLLDLLVDVVQSDRVETHHHHGYAFVIHPVALSVPIPLNQTGTLTFTEIHCDL